MLNSPELVVFHSHFRTPLNTVRHKWRLNLSPAVLRDACEVIRLPKAQVWLTIKAIRPRMIKKVKEKDSWLCLVAYWCNSSGRPSPPPQSRSIHTHLFIRLTATEKTPIPRPTLYDKYPAFFIIRSPAFLSLFFSSSTQAVCDAMLLGLVIWIYNVGWAHADDG